MNKNAPDKRLLGPLVSLLLMLLCANRLIAEPQDSKLRDTDPNSGGSIQVSVEDNCDSIQHSPPSSISPVSSRPGSSWVPQEEPPGVPSSIPESPNEPGLSIGNPFDLTSFRVEALSIGPVEQLPYTLSLDSPVVLTTTGETVTTRIDLASTGLALELDLGPVSIFGRWISGEADTDALVRSGGGGPGRGGGSTIEVGWDYEQLYTGILIPILNWTSDPFELLGTSESPATAVEARLELMSGYWRLDLHSGNGAVVPGTFSGEEIDLDGYFIGGQIAADIPISGMIRSTLFASVMKLEGDGEGTAIQVGMVVTVRF